MKTPEQYLEDLFGYDMEYHISNKDVISLVKQAQIDTIEETCKRCAENVKIKYSYKPVTSTTTSQPDIAHAWVNKESILSVADKLKKELE